MSIEEDEDARIKKLVEDEDARIKKLVEDEDARIKNLVKEKIAMDCSCTVCIEKIENNNAVVLTECQHLFHGVCLDEWINSSERKSELACPNCNQKFDYYHCCCLAGTEKVSKVEIDESQRMAKKPTENDVEIDDEEEEEGGRINENTINFFVHAFDQLRRNQHNPTIRDIINDPNIDNEFVRYIASMVRNNDYLRELIAEEENEEDEENEEISPLQQSLNNISNMRNENLTLLSKLFTSREYNLSIHNTQELLSNLGEKSPLMENVFIEFVKTNSAVDLVVKLMCYNDAVRLLNIGVVEYLAATREFLNIKNFVSKFLFLVKNFIRFLAFDFMQLEYCHSMLFFYQIKEKIDKFFSDFLIFCEILPMSFATLFPRQYQCVFGLSLPDSYISRFTFEKKLNVMDSEFPPSHMIIVVTSRIFNLFMDIANYNHISFDYLDHLNYLFKQFKLLDLRRKMENHDDTMEEVD